MPKVKIEVELSKHLFHAWEREAARRSKRIEDLIGKLATELIREMEREIDNPLVYL